MYEDFLFNGFAGANICENNHEKGKLIFIDVFKRCGHATPDYVIHKKKKDCMSLQFNIALQSVFAT